MSVGRSSRGGGFGTTSGGGGGSDGVPAAAALRGVPPRCAACSTNSCYAGRHLLSYQLPPLTGEAAQAAATVALFRLGAYHHAPPPPQLADLPGRHLQSLRSQGQHLQLPAVMVCIRQYSWWLGVAL